MNNNGLKVKDLMKFIMDNKRDKVFKNMSEYEILMQVDECLDMNSLYYSIDSDNHVTGVILAIPYYQKGVLFVIENLAMNISNLKAFARKAKIQFPDLRLEAIRHNKIHKFNTETLYRKLI